MANTEIAADGLPILRGIIVSVQWVADREQPGRDYLAAQIKVICPHCRRCGRPDFHLHGWDLADGFDVLSHRAAHCADDKSPMRRGGYYIAIDPTANHVATTGNAVYRPSRRRPVGFTPIGRDQ